MSYNKVGINDLFNHVLLIDYLQSNTLECGREAYWNLFTCFLNRSSTETENVTITTFAGDTEMLIVGEGIAEATEIK